MLQLATWRTLAILGTVLLGVVLSVPNFFSKETVASWPSFLPKQQIVLGLDLQGGAYLLYEVDREDYLQKRFRGLVSDVRTELRGKQPVIGFSALSATSNGIQLRLTDPAAAAEVKRRLEPLRNPLNDPLLGGGTVYEFDITESEPGLIRLTVNRAGLEQRLRGIVDQSVGVIERRLNASGTRETSIQREGADRILVEAPGETDPSRVKILVGQTAQMTFHLVRSSVPLDQAAQAREVGAIVVPGVEGDPVAYVLEERALMTGENIADAQPGFDQRRGNEPVVNFRLNAAGARAFADITTKNVNRRFAIVLDDKVISAPVINEPIVGGSGQISGNFTVQSANDLAVLLRAGALPAKLTIVEERTIGPSLGADSIRAGILACIVAGVAVLVFMVVYYGILGVFADLALVAQMFIIIAILSALGATLTLPGIAGIVLTIGMAVDSNVLIYERMREEKMAGRSVISALDAGFTRAFATIFDSQFTTLIAAGALMLLGSGPIRGFAVTLTIGTVSTLFTAYLVTRLIVAVWVRQVRPKVVPL